VLGYISTHILIHMPIFLYNFYVGLFFYLHITYFFHNPKYFSPQLLVHAFKSIFKLYNIRKWKLRGICETFSCWGMLLLYKYGSLRSNFLSFDSRDSRYQSIWWRDLRRLEVRRMMSGSVSIRGDRGAVWFGF
jgi:hypothetical protein